MVDVTEIAIEKIVGLMMEGGITPDTHNLRVGVSGCGCSCLQYEMDFDDKINEGDSVFEVDAIKVVINKPSLL